MNVGDFDQITKNNKKQVQKSFWCRESFVNLFGNKSAAIKMSCNFLSPQQVIRHTQKETTGNRLLTLLLMACKKAAFPTF
jgi:hypothetical protein